MGWLIAFIVLVAVLSIWIVVMYNGLVGLRNRFRNAFSQIDVQLKRRHDLIPNLVETAKGYLAHERGTLEAVIAARNSAEGARQKAAADPGSPDAMRALASAEAGLSGILGKLFALSEAYPDLKASANMTQLSEELTSTENKVAFARQHFNDAIMQYNNKREMFPSNVIANTFNFGPAEFFEIESDEERARVEVKF